MLTIGISAISTFGFLYSFSAFGFFSFAIVFLSTIWYQQLVVRLLRPSYLFLSFQHLDSFLLQLSLYNLVSIIGISTISTFGFVSSLLEIGFFYRVILSLCNLVSTIGISVILTFGFVSAFSMFAFYFPFSFFSWKTLDPYNTRIVSLSVDVKLYYIIYFLLLI